MSPSKKSLLALLITLQLFHPLNGGEGQASSRTTITIPTINWRPVWDESFKDPYSHSSSIHTIIEVDYSPKEEPQSNFKIKKHEYKDGDQQIEIYINVCANACSRTRK